MGGNEALLNTNAWDNPGEGRLVTAHAQIARSTDRVKKSLLSSCRKKLATVFDEAPTSARQAELLVWDAVIEVGRELLESVLSLMCWSASKPQFERNAGARLRLDKDYTLSPMTTFGVVRVPLFAFRAADGKMHSPARKSVFPLYSKCRSSELCLEWETRLGSQLPFRQAQASLSFYTHKAVQLEDSTIARHLATVGAILDRSWTYRTAEDIADILKHKATRDRQTGRPILYFSTDAHALRRYVDDSYDTSWKMINGIRMWCVDRKSGQIVHLGGEYTWGDCREVAARFRTLVAELVPTDEATPQVVLLTDGMEWIRTHVFPEMPADTVFILDFYHAIEHVAQYARDRFGAGTKKAKAWYAKIRRQLYGKRGYTRSKRSKRRGPRKEQTAQRGQKTVHLSENRHGAGEALARQLIEEVVPEAHAKQLDALLHYISENADRMDYPRYRERGIGVGSGAMESLHRIASQMRLKLAGARWLAENALAILNTRMMIIAERWADFWDSPDLTKRLVAAFGGAV